MALTHESAGSIPAPATYREPSFRNLLVARRFEFVIVDVRVDDRMPEGRAVHGSPFENTFVNVRARGPTGRHRRRMPRIRVQFPASPLTGPVAQRRRQLSYKETIGGSSPPGIILADAAAMVLEPRLPAI